jgi:Cu+-exporting ATPase
MKIKSQNKYTLPVGGMTCASCVARVEKVLGKIEGLENVKVNYATEKVSFDVLGTDVNIEKAAEKLEKYGYELKLNDRKSHSDTVSAHKEIDPDYLKLISDFKLALILTIPIFLISMFSGYIEGWPLSPENNNKILFLLSIPILFIPGKRFFTVFWKNLKHLSFEMNSLVAIGTGSAFGYSTVVTLFPDLLITESVNVEHVYFETAAVIITLILLGKVLEARAKKKTNTAIEKLIELKPKEAIIIENGNEIRVHIDDLIVGNNVVVKPGEKIPADGVVIEGFSTVDESMITGESIPIEKMMNSKVIGGTINKNGTFVFEIKAIGDNSILGQIIRMVEEAQGSKAPIQKLADKVASVFVPSVIAVAVLTFIGWIIFGNENLISTALISFVAVLIIACPCALGLATPTAIMVGTGLGAKKGILIKNGESLEIAHKVDTIVLDKTGTLTEGNSRVTDIISNDIDEDIFVSVVASIEKRSHHPIAEAITKLAEKRQLTLKNVESFQNINGMGITGLVDGDMILAGNDKLMEQYSIETENFSDILNQLTTEGKSIVMVAINGELKGVLAVEDPIKDGAKEAINSFIEQGLNVIMLTGDNQKTAQAIAEKVGIREVYAEVLPDQKSDKINELKASGHVVAMIGDGINDAPALVNADLGIAIGTGTDVAIESADFTLVKGNLNDVSSAIKLSRRTIRTIKQNLFWAFIYNTIGIPLAAFGLLNPMIGALAMSLSSVSVISNSLRLKKMEL